MKIGFSGKKIRVFYGEYTLPNGRNVYREYIDFGESVAILPLSNNNKILLIKQFRMPIGKWIYEVPAGTVEEGEEPIECAKRELIEETGYKAGKMIHLFNIYLSPGYSNEYMYVYLARELSYVGARPEEGELINIEWVNIDKIKDMIKNNVIEDSKSIASLLYYISFIHK